MLVSGFDSPDSRFKNLRLGRLVRSAILNEQHIPGVNVALQIRCSDNQVELEIELQRLYIQGSQLNWSGLQTKKAYSIHEGQYMTVQPGRGPMANPGNAVDTMSLG